MSKGDKLKFMVLTRTGLQSNELSCPREKSSMTPCIARDGDLAISDGGHCVGCGANVDDLLREEEAYNKVDPPDNVQQCQCGSRNTIEAKHCWNCQKPISR